MKETRRGRDRCGIGQRLSRAVRRASRYRGMLVIVLWQAPVGPYAGADGSIGLLFGGGLDQYATEFGCSRPTQTASQRYQLAGVEWDRDLDSNVRLEAVAGGITWQPRNVKPWQPGGSSTGVFGHANLRWDWRVVGLGGGLLVLPNMNHVDDGSYDRTATGYTGKPSGYLRVGSAEGLHARIDASPPNALGSQHAIRGGLGWNATRRDRAAWFVGFASLGSSPESLGEGVAGEATLPVTPRVAVRVLGHFGTGFDKTLSGVAVGGRFALGSRLPGTTPRRDNGQ
jgi:hypothetical protein